MHVVCIANIYSLNSLCEAIFSSSVFFQLKAPSFGVHCDLNVRFLTGSDGCLSSRLSLPVRSPSPRKRLHLKFPIGQRASGVYIEHFVLLARLQGAVAHRPISA